MKEDKVKRDPQPAVDEIVSLLSKEISCSDEFLLLLEEERQAIVKMDVTTLMSLSRKKVLQAERLQQLDQAVEKRVETLLRGNTTFAPQSGAKRNNRTVRLSAIAEMGSREHGEKLCQHKEQLVARRRAIADKNHVNMRLVKDTLGYLNDAISLFTPAGNDPAYGKKSGGRKNKFQPALISRAV